MDRVSLMLHKELGREIGRHLADPKVVEIMVNDDGRVWVERLGEGSAPSGDELPPQRVHALLNVLAHMLGTVITPEQPILEGEIPEDGSRIEGVIPPVALAPTLSIRRRASLVFSLDSYVESGRMTAVARDSLRAAVRARPDPMNILVVGGTGSGKTTLVNAILLEIAEACPAHRLLILEDTRELQCSAANYVSLRTSRKVDMDALLRATLRLRPDRIIVGEVRGGEALSLLKAWNTGHPGGCATVHANSAEAGLLRLEQAAMERTHGGVAPMIAEAVHRIVFITRTLNGPLVKEVLAVEGLNPDNTYKLRPL